MAKSKSTSKKSNKKVTTKTNNVNKKIDSMKTNTSNELLKVFRILFAVVVVLSAFYLLTVFIVGKGDSEEKLETAIQYEEILAGSSFSMKNNEYIVVYYDFSDSELSEMASSIYSYSYTGTYRLYTVDMSSGFNKAYVSEESNTAPEKVEDLKINGPTLIRFADGKVQEYIEGKEDIITYLS